MELPAYVFIYACYLLFYNPDLISQWLNSQYYIHIAAPNELHSEFLQPFYLPLLFKSVLKILDNCVM